ncbi:MAG TPA: YciI family protein [Burkholderiales bacterium]|nr:YciI family protein [Burkholderiales bacterium]
MLWAISCVDKPDTAAIREKVLQPHRDYLQSQKGILVLAGATQNDDGTQAIGSLFIVNVDSRAKARSFSDGDPFTKAGVFASITITRMRKGQWNPGAAEGA